VNQFVTYCTGACSKMHVCTFRISFSWIQGALQKL